MNQNSQIESNSVRWGLLSTANINQRIIPAIRQAPRGELVGVASRTAVRLAEYAAEWDIPRTFDSYEAMLADDDIDAVYIGLPNHLHAEWSIKAMRAGKHVLCEKPFALTVADVDDMTAVSQETGRVLAEAFMYRHHPQTKIALEWVQSGQLGDIVRVEAAFSFTMRNQDNIRLDPQKGGGSLWDVGVYPVSLAQAVMGGPPEVVWGQGWIGPSGVDESFAGQMGYSHGRVAQFSSALRTPWHTYAEIIGTAGRLTLTRPFVSLDQPARALTFHPAEGEPQEIDVPDEYLYLGEVQDMHAAILDGQEPYLSLSETRDHVRTVLVLYEAARTGQAVEL